MSHWAAVYLGGILLNVVARRVIRNDKNSKKRCQKTGTCPDKDLEGDASLEKDPLVGILFNIQ